jgi:hypothetical protein
MFDDDDIVDLRLRLDSIDRKLSFFGEIAIADSMVLLLVGAIQFSNAFLAEPGCRNLI